MREQLIQYVELLFAGGQDCEDIKLEILQNTLDRYDDLISQGKVPEAAYRLAISGIGDINEILGTAPVSLPAHAAPAAAPADDDTPRKKILRALAVGLYILSPLPIIFMSGMGADILGLAGTLFLVAIATVMIMLGAKNSTEQEKKEEEKHKSPMQKSASHFLWAIGLAVYFLWSFSSGAWYLTWVIFPILSALDEILTEVIRRKEMQGTVTQPESDSKPFRKRVKKYVWAIGIILFLLVSLRTQAWGATWLMIPITAAAEQLVYAILDYKEALDNET